MRSTRFSKIQATQLSIPALNTPERTTKSRPRRAYGLPPKRTQRPKIDINQIAASSADGQAQAANLIGRRPTLPRTRARSTIGAERLNYRVRDGNGWNPLAMTAQNVLGRLLSEKPWSEYFTGYTQCHKEFWLDSTGPLATVNFMVKPNELLVTVSSTHYCAYTSVLSTW